MSLTAYVAFYYGRRVTEHVDTSASPLYEQIAVELGGRISRGELTGRLASEAELMQSFGVSRATVRRAIGALVDAGVVVARQGVGTFVRPPAAHQGLDRLETLNATLSDQGFRPVMEVVEFAFVEPSRSVRAALQLEPGERVLHVQRLHSIETGPIGVVDLSVRESLGQTWSRSDVEQRPVFELMVRSGIQLGPASQSIRAAAATREMARISGAAEGSPVLVCERVAVDSEGSPLIHALFTYPGDRFEFRVNLPSSHGGIAWVPTGLVIMEEKSA